MSEECGGSLLHRVDEVGNIDAFNGRLDKHKKGIEGYTERS